MKPPEFFQKSLVFSHVFQKPQCFHRNLVKTPSVFTVFMKVPSVLQGFVHRVL